MDWTDDMNKICDSCGNPIKIQVKCTCHDCQQREKDVRVIRTVMLTIVCCFVAMFGGCWTYHKYNADTVKAAVQYYELQKIDKTPKKRADGSTDTNPLDSLQQDYEMVPKKPEKK